MFQDTVTPQPHHYWWASMVAAGLSYLRPFVKLSGTQDEAWNTVVRLVGDL